MEDLITHPDGEWHSKNEPRRDSNEYDSCGIGGE